MWERHWSNLYLPGLAIDMRCFSFGCKFAFSKYLDWMPYWLPANQVPANSQNKFLHVLHVKNMIHEYCAFLSIWSRVTDLNLWIVLVRWSWVIETMYDYCKARHSGIHWLGNKEKSSSSCTKLLRIILPRADEDEVSSANGPILVTIERLSSLLQPTASKRQNRYHHCYRCCYCYSKSKKTKKRCTLP